MYHNFFNASPNARAGPINKNKQIGNKFSIEILKWSSSRISTLNKGQHMQTFNPIYQYTIKLTLKYADTATVDGNNSV